MNHTCTSECITAGYCHKCGELIPLRYDTEEKFCKCPKCNYQNVMENLQDFLRPHATPEMQKAWEGKKLSEEK